MIRYKTKRDSANCTSKFTRSFFAEHSDDPPFEIVRKLVKQVSQDDFDEASIEIEEWLEFNPKEMKEVKLYRFD
jgi:hypothetical protein